LALSIVYWIERRKVGRDLAKVAEVYEVEGLAEGSDEFESDPASEVVRWAFRRFGSSVALASSFEDCVIIHVVTQVIPEIEVIFLDTGSHFPETLEYAEQIRSRYELNLRIVRPGPEADAWPCGSARCCELRKVVPLARALEGRLAWISGLRRVDASTRVDAPIVSWDEARSMVKVNPIATWSDLDVASYVAEHKLPTHPLLSRGYLSIGCAPTTRPVDPGEDRRAGRFIGMGTTECGLHV